MKTFSNLMKALVVSILAFSGSFAKAQTPTYSCVAMNDTLISSTVYQFDIYIYQTGTTLLYLNNYQLSFQVSNTAGILNGGALTGSYVSGSTQLPASLIPGGVSTFLVGGNYEIRVNGVAPSSNGSLIPTTGLRIGTFQITNTAAYAQAGMNLIWWNTTPATTFVYAIVPPAPTGTATLITNMASHTTSLTNPLLNAPVTAFNVTGTGSYCSGGPGIPVGLDGSQTGVMYKLLLASVQTGNAIPGTGTAISFGNQTAGTYTSSGWRKATYLTGAMNGSAVITATAPNPVSISIAASANPVCSGTSVTFTATPTNGGVTPAYQWKVNGVNVGTNSSTYTYTPLNNDAVTCVLTSSDACVTGNPATSNTVTMTVNSASPVSVTIAPSANPVCAGTTVTFTATPVNGGTTPSYQWKVNGVNAGTNSATYAYIPVNNDAVTCVLTSNAPCVTGSPATSNTVTMTVDPTVAVSVSIAPSANPVCAGTSVTFTATPTNGGTTPSYQWQVNGLNVGTNSTTYTYTPLNNDAVTCIMNSNAPCATGSPATSNTVTMTVNPSLPVSISIAPSGNPVCTGTSVTFTATPTNGGTTPAYQWKVNGVNVGTNSTTYTYTPLNNDAVTCVLTSNATCASGSPATSNTVTMTVNSSLPVSISIAPSANPVCAGTSVTYTATPTNGGTTPAYQWKVNGVNVGTNSTTYSYIPVNNDAVTCVLTSSDACATGNPATSNTVTMTVNPTVTVSVSIAPSANPVCAGTSVTYTATPTNGGTIPAYQWKVNGVNVGTNSPTYSYIPVNNDAVTCVLTSNATCTTGNPATSNTVTMTVNPLLAVSVSIAPSANPVCTGTSVTYTATPTNGGTTPSYQWQVNGLNVGTNSATYSYIPLNNDAVTCILTSNATCPTGNPATSNTVTMTVNSASPVSVSIAPSANPVCAGTSVTYTATPTNGGTTPSYQWKVNGVNVGTNSATYAYIPVNNDAVTCVLTSNATCATGNPATSNTVTMTVNPTVAVSVSIAPSANPVCAGTSVTYTATPTNGGTTPAYQWKVNGVNVGTNSPTYSYIPVNSDAVTCVLTSNVICPTGNPATSNTVTMTVNPLLAVSVSIAPSANPVCTGTSVTYTATPTNGGTTPSYQWQVNGLNVGTNSSTYTYTPLNNDAVTCILTSNATCPTGNPATSNTVTMTVNSALPVSISIAPSSNPVCAGTSVTYTATPTNGGTTPAYQWQVNGLNVGTNSPTYSYIPVNNDAVTCVLTSSLTCSTGSPATSNTVTMTVNPNLPVSVTIAPSSNPVCAGTSVTYTATPTNGGTTPAYQWKVNGVNVGTNSATYSYIPVNSDAVTCVLTSNATCPTGNPATSNTVTMTVNPLLAVSVSIAPSANPVCTGTSVTYTATPTNGGTTPSYQWQVNGLNVGTNSATYSYIPLNNDAVTCILTSNATCATGNPATSNIVTMTVNSALPVSVSIAPSANPVCAGTSVTYTATPTNGGTTPSYQWKVNGVNVGTNSPTYSYIPVNNDAVTCVLTSSLTCSTGSPATSNTVTMTVNPVVAVSVSVSPSANPVCAGTSVTYTATPTNGGTTPAYQWKVNGVNVGTNSPTYSYIPVNNDAVTCVLTSNATCTSGNPATSNIVTMTVNPLLAVSVSIAPTANPVCTGTSVTYTATPTNGGTTPAYQWKVNGVNVGTNSATYSYIPLNNDAVTCVLTSNATCPTGNPATSNTVTMTVNASLPVSVSIAPTANPVCSGTSVTYTATPTNGGTTPSYQWKVNGVNVGTNSATYSYIPVNNDAVTCVLTSNVTCATGNPATSNTVTMTVNTTVAVSVSVAPSANPVCAGSSVTYTATPTNGGTTPVYQWKVNGVNVGTNSPTYSYIPVNSDAVTCDLTSNATCTTGNPATSNIVTMTVNPLLPVSVSIAPTANPVCTGTSVTYTATPTNGGTTPAYQWKVNGINVGTNSATYSYIPLNNDAVTCVLTSNATCPTGNPATSNTITMTVNSALPVSVSIAPSSNPVCAGTSVTYTATPTNGGTTPAYQWKVNGVNVGTNSATYSYIPANSDAVTCVLTSNATCATGNPATSNTVTMTVNPVVAVSVSIAPSANPVCAGTSVTYTATPTNGGTTPAYQWKVNGVNVGTNSATYSYIPVNSDAVTCVLTSNATCASGNPATSNTVTMTVNPNLPVSVTIAPSVNPVCSGTSVTYTATPANGGTTPAYQWKVNGVNVGTNSPTYSYIPVNNDAVTCVLTSNATCATGNPATSNTVTMSVNTTLPVSVSIAPTANPVCAGTSVTYTATPTNGGTTPGYQWKVNGVNVGTNSPTYSYTPVNSDAVTCVLTSNATCTTGNPATSNTVTMTVNPVLAVSVSIAPTANPVCSGTSVTYTATPVNGGTTPAYQWKVNGVNAGTNSPTYSYVPANNDAVTCVLTSNATCTSGNPATSNTVTMTVNPTVAVSVSVAPSANPVCSGTAVTYTATPTNGGTTPSYQWKVNGINAGTNSPTYTYTPLNNDVVTCVLTSNVTCATGNPATSNAVTMAVNTTLPVSVNIAASLNPVCSGATVTYTATPANGGTAPVYQWKVNGINVGTNSTTYSYIPLNGDIVTCVLTSNLSCTTGNPATSNAVTMVVNVAPVPTLSGPATVCATTTGNVYTTEAGMSGYTWIVSAGGTITAGGTSTSNTVTVTWGTAGAQTVRVNYTNPATGCSAASPTIYNVTVNSLPVPTLAGPTPVCAGTTGNVYTTQAGMTSYVWNVSAGGTITAGGTSTSNSVTVNWTTAGARTVSVIYTNSNGCTAAAPAVYNVTVNPLPVPTITGPASACINQAGNIYSTQAGMTSYIWSVSAGGTITAGGTATSSSVTVTWTTLGPKTVSVNYTDNTTFCTGAAPTVYNITVNSLPTPTISGSNLLCAGSTGYVYTTQAGMSNYAWSVSPGGTIAAGGTPTSNTVTVNWNTAGAQSVSVNYTNASGCSAPVPVSYPVTVNPLPNPSLAGIQNVCAGTAGNIYITDPGMTNYTWFVGAGGTITAGGTPTSNSVTVTWNTAGNESVGVNYQNSFGCWAAAATSLPVTVMPQPVPTISGPAAICAISTGNVYTTQAGMTNYAWNVSAGGVITAGGTSTSNTVTVTWNTPGAQTVSVSYTGANGCIAAAPGVYNVNVTLAPAPTLTGPVSACATSTGNVYTTEAGMSNYIWTVSAGGSVTAGGTSTSNTVTVTWNTPGPQTVSVNYTNGGCTAISPTVNNVTVNALPVPSLAGPAAVCATTTGNVYTTQAGMTNYVWSVSAGGTITAGGTSGSNTVTVTWNTPGAHTVSVNYTNSNGCTAASPAIYNVTVNPLPTPTIAGPAPVCLNATGNVYTTQAGMTNYIWNVSAGGTITAGGTIGSNTVTVTWNSSGPQTVSVNYTNGTGCTAASPVVYPVTVNSLPVPTISGPASVCETTTGNVYTTQAGMTSYAWSVSAGGTITAGGTPTSNTVTVTWNTAGARTVSVNYIDPNGCTAVSPVVYNVTVNALPVPTLSGPSSACATYPGNVYTTQAGMSNYIWSVSPGGTVTAGGTSGSSTVTVTWNTPGAQTVGVNYTNANGCSAAAPAVYNVTVNATPTPTVTGPTPVCVTYPNNLYTTEPGMTNYIWSISPGGTVTGGGTSTSNTVTVTWNTSGPQTVSVNYTNATGCSASVPYVYPVSVNALPVPVITGPASACTNTTGNVYSTATGMSNYVWVVSPGGVITSGGSTSDNTVTVTWQTEGPQSVSVNYVDLNGCSANIPTAYPVTVAPLPVPTITGQTEVCAGIGYVTYTTESGMTNYTWGVTAGGTISGGGGTGDNFVTVHWNIPGGQTVSVNYTNTGGCTGNSPTALGVQVNDVPSPAGTITGTPVVCGGVTGVQYSVNPVPGALTYVWTVPAGATIVSGGSTNVITVDFAGNASSGNMTVYGNNLCGNGTTSPPYGVTVNPLPATAGIITGPADVCLGDMGQIYSVAPIDYATGYVWTTPPGAVIVSGGNTNVITVDFPGGTSSGVFTVIGTNSCGNGTVSPDYAVGVHPVPPAPVISANGPVMTSNIPTGNKWFFNGVEMPGETGQTCTATQTGFYWATQTQNGCESDTSNNLYIVIIGIEEVHPFQFVIYPVPNEGIFKVSISYPNETDFTLQVYNNIGVKIFEKKPVHVKGETVIAVDLRPVPTGIYHVILKNESDQLMKKVLIRN